MKYNLITSDEMPIFSPIQLQTPKAFLSIKFWIVVIMAKN